MELLPGVKLSITDGDGGRSCAWWIGGQSFDVYEAIAIGHDLHLCISNDREDLRHFSIRVPHVMGAMAGDVINIDDVGAELIAQGIHDMIESGALLSDA